MPVAVHAIGSTGGHCDDQNGFRAGLFGRETGPEDGVINNPADGRRAVRLNILATADFRRQWQRKRQQLLVRSLSRAERDRKGSEDWNGN